MKWLFICALLICGSGPPAAAQDASSTPTSGIIVDSLDQDSPAQPPEKKKEAAPEHLSTGWSSLLKDSASDFVAFPKRKSTWTILGIGAAAALAVHPADDYVQSHIVGNETANNFFSLGRISCRTLGRRPLCRPTRRRRIPDEQVFGGRL